MFFECAFGGRVDVVTDFLCRGSRRRDFEIPGAAGFPDHILSYELRHRAAADVSVADEKNAVFCLHDYVYLNNVQRYDKEVDLLKIVENFSKIF